MKKKMIILAAAAVSAAAVYGLVPTYAEKLYKRAGRKEKGNTLFLTFDDGPSEYTPEILSVLKENDVKATFFMVADFARKNPGMVYRVKNDGHLIGMHAKEHKSALLRLPVCQKRDITGGDEIMRAFGITGKFFRPPWGHFNLTMMNEVKKLGYKTVLWDVMAEDWEKNTDADIICNKLLSRVQGGDIICLHDGRGAAGAPGRTAAALKKALPILKARGFEFRTVDEYYEK